MKTEDLLYEKTVRNHGGRSYDRGFDGRLRTERGRDICPGPDYGSLDHGSGDKSA